MTTTTDAPTSIEVGVPIRTQEQLLALPRGAVLRLDGTTDYEAYAANGLMHLRPVGSNIPGHRIETTRMDGSLRVHALPAGKWINAAGRFMSKPPGVTTEPEVTTVEGEARDDSEDTAATVSARGETLMRYIQRFRTTVVGAQQYHGVNAEPMERALTELAVPEFEPTPGMIINVSDRTLLDSLPDGSVLRYGVDPKQYATYGIYGKVAGALSRMVGGADVHQYGNYYLEVVPGKETPDSWVTEPWDEEQDALIIAFKQRAWRAGEVAKRRARWCEAYEAAMARANIDRNITEVDPANTGLLPDAVAALPVGSVVRYTASEGTALYMRDDSADNPAKTRRIGGVLPGSWCSRPVALVFEAVGRRQMRIPCVNYAEMDSMPNGTTISDGNYTYARDTARQLWQQVGGYSYTYPSTSFSLGTMTYRSFA